MQNLYIFCWILTVMLITVFFFRSIYKVLQLETTKKAVIKRISEGKYVTLLYTLSDKTGELLDDKYKQEYFTYVHGEGQILAGLEKRLTGLAVGKKKKIVVPVNEAYGEVDQSNIVEVDKKKVPDDAAKVGALLKEIGEGKKPGKIIQVKENTLIIDYNHPLAAKKLVFDVEVIDVDDEVKGDRPTNVPEKEIKPVDSVKKPEVKNPKISDNCIVNLEYILTDSYGNVIEERIAEKSITYIHGKGEIKIGLEKRLTGLTAGTITSFEVPPEEGFGKIDPAAFQDINKDEIFTDSLKVGTILSGIGPEKKDAKIHEIKDNTVILDFNHPLAGQTLKYEVNILSVQRDPSAPEEEIESTTETQETESSLEKESTEEEANKDNITKEETTQNSETDLEEAPENKEELDIPTSEETKDEDLKTMESSYTSQSEKIEPESLVSEDSSITESLAKDNDKDKISTEPQLDKSDINNKSDLSEQANEDFIEEDNTDIDKTENILDSSDLELFNESDNEDEEGNKVDSQPLTNNDDIDIDKTEETNGDTDTSKILNSDDTTTDVNETENILDSSDLELFNESDNEDEEGNKVDSQPLTNNDDIDINKTEETTDETDTSEILNSDDTTTDVNETENILDSADLELFNESDKEDGKKVDSEALTNNDYIDIDKDEETNGDTDDKAEISEVLNSDDTTDFNETENILDSSDLELFNENDNEENKQDGSDTLKDKTTDESNQTVTLTDKVKTDEIFNETELIEEDQLESIQDEQINQDDLSLTKGESETQDKQELSSEEKPTEDITENDDNKDNIDVQKKTESDTTDNIANVDFLEEDKIERDIPEVVSNTINEDQKEEDVNKSETDSNAQLDNITDYSNDVAIPVNNDQINSDELNKESSLIKENVNDLELDVDNNTQIDDIDTSLKESDSNEFESAINKDEVNNNELNVESTILNENISELETDIDSNTQIDNIGSDLTEEENSDEQQIGSQDSLLQDEKVNDIDADIDSNTQLEGIETDLKEVDSIDEENDLLNGSKDSLVSDENVNDLEVDSNIQLNEIDTDSNDIETSDDNKDEGNLLSENINDLESDIDNNIQLDDIASDSKEEASNELENQINNDQINSDGDELKDNDNNFESDININSQLDEIDSNLKEVDPGIEENTEDKNEKNNLLLDENVNNLETPFDDNTQLDNSTDELSEKQKDLLSNENISLDDSNATLENEDIFKDSVNVLDEAVQKEKDDINISDLTDSNYEELESDISKTPTDFTDNEKFVTEDEEKLDFFSDKSLSINEPSNSDINADEENILEKNIYTGSDIESQTLDEQKYENEIVTESTHDFDNKDVTEKNESDTETIVVSNLDKDTNQNDRLEDDKIFSEEQKHSVIEDIITYSDDETLKDKVNKDLEDETISSTGSTKKTGSDNFINNNIQKKEIKQNKSIDEDVISRDEKIVNDNINRTYTRVESITPKPIKSRRKEFGITKKKSDILNNINDLQEKLNNIENINIDKKHTKSKINRVAPFKNKEYKEKIKLKSPQINKTNINNNLDEFAQSNELTLSKSKDLNINRRKVKVSETINDLKMKLNDLENK